MADGTLAPALAVAVGTGVGTFFSPCAYPLLPGYVAYYVGQTDGAEPTLGGALARGFVAGTGVVAAFAALAGVAFWIGHEPLSNLTIVEPVIGILLIGLGVLFLLGRAPSLTVPLPARRSSVLGFGVFGAGYALAAAGCVAPAFLTVIAAALSLSAGGAALVIGTYAGVVSLLMIATTVATGMGLLAGRPALADRVGSIERLAGAVMILAGIGQLYLATVVLEAI